jgi:membrane protease YdiL (CAAX protease family)
LAFWGIPLAVIAIIILYRLDETSSSVDLGLSKPKNWKKTIMLGLSFGGINFGIGFILNMLVFIFGLPPPSFSSSTFASIQGDYAVLARHLLVAWTTASFGEEIIWRGFFMERVARIFDNTQKGWIAGLISSSIVFGLIHSYQGITGIIFTGIAGLVLGIMYLKTDRNLYTTIIGHGVNNTILFLMMFFS